MDPLTPERLAEIKSIILNRCNTPASFGAVMDLCTAYDALAQERAWLCQQVKAMQETTSAEMVDLKGKLAAAETRIAAGPTRGGEVMEFTDRYKALGIPYPDRATMCKDQCEGIGYVPIHASETDPKWAILWMQAHQKCVGVFNRTVRRFIGREECNGWHFVKCPSCNGTGKQP